MYQTGQQKQDSTRYLVSTCDITGKVSSHFAESHFAESHFSSSTSVLDVCLSLAFSGDRRYCQHLIVFEKHGKLFHGNYFPEIPFRIISGGPVNRELLPYSTLPWVGYHLSWLVSFPSLADQESLSAQTHTVLLPTISFAASQATSITSIGGVPSFSSPTPCRIFPYSYPSLARRSLSNELLFL